MKLILVINPGSTSTKVALFINSENVIQNNLTHSAEEISKFERVADQLEMRQDLIEGWMKEEGYSIERCNFYVEYFYNNKIHRYIPDFIIKKDSVFKVIEIKCEYLKNFEFVYKYLEKRVQSGLQSSNNLSTYKKEVLELKQKAITDYCKERGWSFEMITLDNSKFNLLYNRAKRIRSNDKIGSKKNSSL